MTNGPNNRKFLRHMPIRKGVCRFFGQSHLQPVSHCRGVPIQIYCNNLELSVVQRELVVLLFDLLQCPFGGGYLVGIPKSCFRELYKTWLVFQPYHSVLSDVWQNLAQGYTPQAVECVQHLQLFLGKAGGRVSYDHPEWSNPASQPSSI